MHLDIPDEDADQWCREMIAAFDERLTVELDPIIRQGIIEEREIWQKILDLPPRNS